MKRSFVDSGVLIAAARGNSDRTERALSVLGEVDRIFISSVFVKLETLPKAICYKQQPEVNFYKLFFEGVMHWATDLEVMTQSAYQLAYTYGLSGIDALHIAAAISLNADEFITTEKSTKPMYRVPNLHFVSI
ncbi:MAG: PIN domain-containing protein [Phormidesmis sp. CAN_BIN44]|nr:PIN domain-containing protein [Phormidesmis sp. CAN_BIN44]